MGSVYAFLLIVMLIGPERMNHDVIWKDRKKLHGEREREKEKRALSAELTDVI